MAKAKVSIPSDGLHCNLASDYSVCSHIHWIDFHFFEALDNAFEVQFFVRVSFLYLIKDTDSM